MRLPQGGKGRGRRRGQRTRSAQDDGSLPCRQRGQISGSLQGGGRGYPGCRKDGGLQVTAEWRSPDRGRMEVSRLPQNGGLRIAAEWRSPGHRRMEVSRSPQDGGLQVAAKWRSSGRRRSADHCGKVEVFVAKLAAFKSPLCRGLHRVEIFRLPRCEGLMSPMGEIFRSS